MTGDFSMCTGGCVMSLLVDAAGQASRVVVSGKATLNGYLYLCWDDNYRPAAGTSIDFFVYGGQRVGTFNSMNIYAPNWESGGVWHNIDFTFPDSQGHEGVRGVVVVWLDTP